MNAFETSHGPLNPQAVLAGLPSTDEAVKISQLALGAGKTLQDVIEYSRQQAQEVGPVGEKREWDGIKGLLA
jgi:hypothetical protein